MRIVSSTPAKPLSQLSFLLIIISSVFSAFSLLYFVEAQFMVKYFLIVLGMLYPSLYVLIYCPSKRNFSELLRTQSELTQLKESLETRVTKRAQKLRLNQKDSVLIDGMTPNVRQINVHRVPDKAIAQSFKSIKAMLRAFVNALTVTTEIRDPYTAHHQQRVAGLAFAIGKEMDLSEEQLVGIYNAGILHDIGKIYVPMDILTKPGKLTEMEMGIVKSHPLVGHKILKEIPFESPVAEFVLQHHERVNGSGYPKGLIGIEIRLEAKILGVADVVEAMASHRPYRPAIGLEKALDEIKKNKGILYDPEVVDACSIVCNSNGCDIEKIAKIIV